MNKYVTQTIVNLAAAGFIVKAWADNEYFSIEDIDDYSTYSIVAFKDGVKMGGVYIVAENEGLEAISDYSTVLEQYIPREDFDLYKGNTDYIYVLSIIESSRESIALGSIFGPMLFETKQLAMACLFGYVTKRVIDWPDWFVDDEDFFDELSKHAKRDKPGTPVEMESFFAGLDEPGQDKFISWFFEHTCDEMVLAEYKIQALLVDKGLGD